MENRRTFERFGSDMIFWIKKLEGSDDFQPFGIENISAGGILVRTKAVFTAKSFVALSFELPQYTDLISAEAEVRHVVANEDDTYRVGLQFSKVENLEIDLLIRYLAELFE